MEMEMKRRPLVLPPPTTTATDGEDQGLRDGEAKSEDSNGLDYGDSTPAQPSPDERTTKPTTAKMTRIRITRTTAPPRPTRSSQPPPPPRSLPNLNLNHTPSPPTRSALSSLLRAHLSTTLAPSDALHACGASVTALLPAQPRAVLRVAHAKLHAFPFKDVPACWLRAWSEACLWECVRVLWVAGGDDGGVAAEGDEEERDEVEEEGDEQWLDAAIRVLDMGLILAGGAGREDAYAWAFAALQDLLDADDAYDEEYNNRRRERTGANEREQRGHGRPRKRRKVGQAWTCPPAFPPPTRPTPALRNPIPRVDARRFGFDAFQAHLDHPRPTDDDDDTNSADAPDSSTPLILTHALAHWPAIASPTRRWRDPRYLLRRTLGGRRLVPVEIGRSYTDEGWGQRIMSVREFVRRYVFCDDDDDDDEREERGQEKQKGYLAQHDLLSQIPCLRADIAVPDYCFTVPPPPTNPPPPPPTPSKPPARPDFPLVHAWLGPARTVSPLHTDPYHNLLAQVVGAKYVRLYAPRAPAVRARGVGADGVDLGNTGVVDVGEAMEIEREQSERGERGETSEEERGEEERGERGQRREKRAAFEAQHPGFLSQRCFDCVLAAGEVLYVPRGWWHYVESLAASFSVSFWWDRVEGGDEGDG